MSTGRWGLAFCGRCDLGPLCPQFLLWSLDHNICKDVEVRVWEQDVLVCEHWLCGQDTLGLAGGPAETKGDSHCDAESTPRADL